VAYFGITILSACAFLVRAHHSLLHFTIISILDNLFKSRFSKLYGVRFLADFVVCRPRYVTDYFAFKHFCSVCNCCAVCIETLLSIRASDAGFVCVEKLVETNPFKVKTLFHFLLKKAYVPLK
jgi:hypothetical protein